MTDSSGSTLFAVVVLRRVREDGVGRMAFMISDHSPCQRLLLVLVLLLLRKVERVSNRMGAMVCLSERQEKGGDYFVKEKKTTINLSPLPY